jgi:MoaA/NifB/PqqE/SkfB family radical SAM enzyme
MERFSTMSQSAMGMQIDLDFWFAYLFCDCLASSSKFRIGDTMEHTSSQSASSPNASHSDKDLLIMIRPLHPKCNVNCKYCGYARTNRLEFTKKLRQQFEICNGMFSFSRIIRRIEKIETPKTLFLVPDSELFISKYYTRQFIRLMNNPSVKRCCFQTNLCFDLEHFIGSIEQSKLMLWVTYHPGQYTPQQERVFFENLRTLKGKGIDFSVGVVATKDRIKHLHEYKETFSNLGIHMWINGMHGVRQPFYNESEKKIIQNIDPLAKYETDIIASKGLKCCAGMDSIFIDFKGSIHRCPIVGESMGNILKDSIQFLHREEPCPREDCGCYIAYMNLLKPEFDLIYGDTKLCRLPKQVQ